MGAERDEAFLDVLHRIASSLSDTYGLTEAQATELGNAITRHVAERYGGERVYIHAQEIRSRRRRILEAFTGANRDEVCAKEGISRATFYRLLGER